MIAIKIIGVITVTLMAFFFGYLDGMHRGWSNGYNAGFEDGYKEGLSQKSMNND